MMSQQTEDLQPPTILEKLLDFPMQSKVLLIAFEEIRILSKTLKFRALVTLILLPAILQIIAPGYISASATQEFQKIVGARVLNSFGLANVDLFGLITQILTLLIASEFIARELEDGTLGLLVTRPCKRSEVMLGKVLGFLIALSLVIFFTISLYSVTITIQLGGSFDDFFEIVLLYLLPSSAIYVLGFLTIACVTTFFSVIFNRSLYAALVSVVLILGVNILFATTPELNLRYQMGVLLEEFLTLSGVNLYKGDPLLTLAVFAILNAGLLTISLLVFYRKEIQ